MKTSNEGLELIQKFEDFRAEAYICAGGKATIGYGHTAGVQLGDTISIEQAQMYLRHDVGDAEAAVDAMIKVPLKQCQFDALVSFVFNVGSGHFRSSTLRRLINENCSDVGMIKKAFLMWVKSRGKVLPGLVKRREEEFALFIKDE